MTDSENSPDNYKTLEISFRRIIKNSDMIKFIPVNWILKRCLNVQLKKFAVCNNVCFHSHKKREDSLETRVKLLIFLLELEISVMVVQSIHQNSKKW